MLPYMRRVDRLSQRRLLELLRTDIVLAQRGNPHARERLARLVAENPHSLHATAIAYNLGRAKYVWLMREFPDARAAAAASLRRPLVGRSLAEIRSWLEPLAPH